MLLDWLLKTEEGNISYEELKCPPRTGLDGVNEDGNLPYGRALQRDINSLVVNIALSCTVFELFDIE